MRRVGCGARDRIFGLSPDAPDDPHSATVAYYERNAEDYVRATRELDMSSLREAFIEALPAGGRILDAGCGSGRDTAAFLARGFEVSAFDASPALCASASEFTGISVSQQRFQEIEDQNQYDGIWACASLLHLPWKELRDAIGRLSRALKPGGHLYMCFKVGDGQGRAACGRHFTHMNEERLATLLRDYPGLKVVRVWVTPSTDPGRPDTEWLNVLLCRASCDGVTDD